MKKLITILFSAIALLSCNSNATKPSQETKSEANTAKDFDLEGHRGARGLYPENSIMGFVEATDIGVNTLEMDICVTKDKKLVVSHDPWMSSEICRTPDGKDISEKDQTKYAIYQMTYDQVRKFDCGLKPHPRFPDQYKAPAIKPLLKYVVEVVETYTTAHYIKPVQYNIETKSLPEWDDAFEPEPEEFCKLLYDELKKLGILDRVIIQSFDVRTLQIFKRDHPVIRLALLVENDYGFDMNIAELGFDPDIYSPDYHLVDGKLVQTCHQRKIKVLPWTVDTEEAMDAMLSLGVDGLITDFPDLAITLK